MKTHPLTKFACTAALTALAILSASSVTAACQVWWQQKCCAKAGVTGVTCGVVPNQWRCAHNLIADPSVGSLSNANAGWDGPWAISIATCTYNVAGCGFAFGQCIYAIPPVSVNCGDVHPPSTPPDCDMCP